MRAFTISARDSSSFLTRYHVHQSVTSLVTAIVTFIITLCTWFCPRIDRKFIIHLHKRSLFNCSEMTFIAYKCSFLRNLTLCKKTWPIISWRAAPAQCQCPCNCSTLRTVTLLYGDETASTDDHHIPALQLKALPIKSNREILLCAISFIFEWSYTYTYYYIVLSLRVIKRKGLFVRFSRSTQSIQWTCIGVTVSHAVVVWWENHAQDRKYSRICCPYSSSSNLHSTCSVLN
jgi:hypothetical protein